MLGTREISVTQQAKPDETQIQKIISHTKKDSYLDNQEIKAYLTKNGKTFLYNKRQYIPSILQKELIKEIYEHLLYGH